jgi:mono/diheme cytochrome c family protein
MKLIPCLLALLLALPAAVFAKAVVREEPLTWEKSARLPGDQLYRNLCAACHADDGSGNGIASQALGVGTPDLTGIAARNGGVFPHKKVERLIGNQAHYSGYGETVMPEWEQQFMYVRTGLGAFQREAHARNRIHELTEFVETLQASVE